MGLYGLKCGDFMRQFWRFYESNDRFFFDILFGELFFSGIQCGWPAATRLIMQTFVTMVFPFLDPCSNGISVHVIYLGNGFDRYALATQQKTMGPHTSSM